MYLKLVTCFVIVIALASCEPPKEESLQYGHYHSCAERNAGGGDGFTATIKVPDDISDKAVYLSDIKFIDKQQAAPAGTPNAGRQEIVLAKLSFSTDPTDELKTTKSGNYRWDKKCRTLYFTSDQPKDAISKIGIASIQMAPIKGLNEIYFDEHEHEKHKDPCLDFFTNCKSKEVAYYRGGFSFFHPGHNMGDPRSGHDGIPIGEEGP